METRASWEAWQNSDEARKERIKARKAKRAQATDRIRSKMRLVSTSLSSGSVVRSLMSALP